jgi:diacylglycerol kinase (ATP)
MSAQPRDILQPFRVALSGVVYTFRTQRHMRVHLYVTLTVVVAALLLNLRIKDLLVLLFMINFVLVAEMFNSAIEATVDLVSPNYNPMAKFAKDIAAGAVLVTTIMAIVVGSLIALGDDTFDRIRLSLTSETLGIGIVPRIFLGVFLAVLIVIIGKGLGQRGQAFRGGLVSGHAALGFFFAVAVIFITDNMVAAALAILLACLVAQSRWEAKIHSAFELTLGATVGVLLGLVLFGLAPK